MSETPVTQETENTEIVPQTPVEESSSQTENTSAPRRDRGDRPNGDRRPPRKDRGGIREEEKEFKEEMHNTGFTLEELYMKDTQLCSKYEYSTRTKIKQCRIRLYNVLLEESQKHNLLFTDFQNILNIKDLIQWRMNNNK